MRLPDTKGWWGAALSAIRYPLAVSLVAGLLISLAVVLFLQRELESEGRAKMRASLVLIKANLSVDTIRAKGMGVAAMLGLNEPILKEAALGKYALDAPGVLERLSIARKYFNYEGLYVIDRQGVIAANDTNSTKSTGKSVAFRPYFQQAIQGKESVYMAVGTNSNIRGIYYAAPVYEKTDRLSNIIGVIGVKVSADFLDGLLRSFGDDSMLLSPQGVVFASTRPEWLWTMTPPFSKERAQEVRDLKQFGKKFEGDTPTVLGFNPYGRDIRLNGERFAVEQEILDLQDSQGEWTLVKLRQASLWFPMQDKLKTAAFIWLLALLAGVVLQRQRSFRIEASRKLAAEMAERRQAENSVLETAQRGASIAGLNAAMRGAEGFEEFSQRYFLGLAALTGIRYGLLYVADDASGTLKLCGGYGSAVTNLGTTIPYGYGLAGQCAIDRQPLRLDHPPEDYIHIVSGTGQAKPSYLLLRPLALNGSLVGVVELAGLGELQEQHLAMLKELETVAAAWLSITERKRQFHEEVVGQIAFQQALIDSIPNPIFYKGIDTRFLGCNKAYERAFNVPKQAFIGKRVLDLEYLPYPERMAYQKEDEDVIARQGTVKRVITLRYADGGLRRCLYWVTTFLLDDGVKGGLVGTFIEMDADGESSLSRYEAIGQEN